LVESVQAGGVRAEVEGFRHFRTLETQIRNRVARHPVAREELNVSSTPRVAPGGFDFAPNAPLAITFTNLIGKGSAVQVTDSTLTNSQRFYRVGTQ